MSASGAALAAATALHAGFQLVVTVLVYPAFADVPDDAWRAHHARHSRRITGLVGIVYGALLAAGAAVLVAGPTTLQAVSLVATALALAVTAFVAAPAHGRLSARRDMTVLRRLVVADRVRCAGAALAAVTAFLAVVTA